MNTGKMAALQGRKVIAFPDVDGYTEWTQKAQQLRSEGIRIDVSDLLERSATDEERSQHIDIADWIIGQLTAKSPSTTDEAPQKTQQEPQKAPQKTRKEQERIRIPFYNSNGDFTHFSHLLWSDLTEQQQRPETKLAQYITWKNGKAVLTTVARVEA
jgi:hypothetical protein